MTYDIIKGPARGKRSPGEKDLKAKIKLLEEELAEKTQTLEAIQGGEVDAILVSTKNGDRIYTLKGAEEPYRLLFEQMNEGAVMVSEKGEILYCNHSFSDSMRVPIEKIIGAQIESFIDPSVRSEFNKLLKLSRSGAVRDDLFFQAGDGTRLPMQLSINYLTLPEVTTYCIVVGDLTERIQAEDALRSANEELDLKVQERTKDLSESEAKYRGLFESIHDPVTVRKVIFNERHEAVDLITLDANPASLMVRGAHSFEDVIGKKDSDIYGPELNAAGLGLAKLVSATKRPITQHMHYEFNERDYLVTCVPLDDDRVIFTSVDITEIKKNQNELEQARDIAQKYLNLAGTLILGLDMDGKIQVLNQKGCEVVGCTASPVGRSWFDFIPDRYQKEIREAFALMKKGEGLIGDYENPILTVMGEERLISWHNTVMRDREGKVVGTLSSGEDITEQRRYENALQDSEAKYRDLFETVQEIFYIDRLLYDEMGNLIDWIFDDVNPAGLKLLQKSDKEDVVGKTGSEVLGAKFASFYLPMMEEARRSEKAVTFRYHSPHAHRDMLTSYVVHGDRLISAQMDITDINRAQKEVEEYAEKLQRSNAELQRFAHVASHDLQEPLRMVTSFMSLLDKKYKDKLDPEAKEYISYAVEGGKRMKALIDDLLAYSRVETGRKEFEPVDMNELVKNTLMLLTVPIEEKNAEITIDHLPTIKADPSQMIQVMQNLVSNAIKFNDKTVPVIHISASEGEEEWTFSVKDNGIGLNSDFSDRIFVMFQRLHTRKEYPGTGIGLPIAKKIVERHGGRIWVESVEGNGATFFFTVPKTDGGQ